MRLTYSEDAAIDIEEILNWIDIKQGFEAKNSWADNLFKFSDELKSLQTHKVFPAILHEFYVYTPPAWNYQFVYTLEKDLITIIKIREIKSSF